MPLRVAYPYETVAEAINACEPQFHLPITDVSGTTIKDISGNGRDGTLSGAVTLNNTTAPDGAPAALFAGGHIEIPHNTAYACDATYGMTVGCLVKFDSIPTALRFILTKGTTSKYEWGLWANNTGGNGNFSFSLDTAAGTTACARISTRSPLTTSWCLLIGNVHNRNVNASNLMHIFKDSMINIADFTASGTGSPYAVNDAPVRIGARADGTPNPMNGYIRNPFMCSYALDRGSIQRIIIAAQREGWGF